MNLLRRLNRLLALATVVGVGALVAGIHHVLVLFAAWAFLMSWYALLALCSLLLVIGLLAGDRGDFNHLRWMAPSIFGAAAVSYVFNQLTAGMGH